MIHLKQCDNIFLNYKKGGDNMIKFKIDVMQALKNKGYNTNYIRQNKLLSEATLQQIRTGKTPGIKSLNVICALLNKQPGQILEYVPDDQTTK